MASIDDATPEEWNAASRPGMVTDLRMATDLKSMMTMPIKGYEGLYSISRAGHVISHGNKSNHKEVIILQPSYDKDGYKRVTLQKNKKRKYFRVCRLVAEAFIANPENKPFVNHIDKDKTNDRCDNLEWTTAYENWKHSESDQSNQELAVIKLSMSGDYICEYKSLMDAARDTKINQGNITNCLKGRCKSIGGFRWIEK
jgi:hypothetical protein